MGTGLDQLSEAQVLAGIDAAMDVLIGGRVRLATDAEQLALLKGSLRVEARLKAWQQQLAANIEASEAAWREHRTSTVTWLVEAVNLTGREAARLVKAGQGLVRFPVVGAAAAQGEVLASQAEAITSVLRDLPRDFPPGVVTEAQELMVGFAASHNAVELRRLTGHLLAVLAPETAEGLEADRLEREHRAAVANRHLEFRSDGHGSVLLRGSLPVVEAEPLIRIVDAYAEAEKRALDGLDPYAEYVTPPMRRVDGLLAMVHHHSQQALAPVNGGDRPRVVLTLSYDKLVKGCVGAALLGAGEPVPASVARRLLCDADILPIVLGGASEILDVGRTERLVTPAIRAALELRDGGCVFPGCDKPPSACHAHHIVRWPCGGPTALWNLVLLCPHHHGIVEPGHDPAADRWKVRLRGDGVPEILPPRRVDATQRPRLHARFQTPQRR